ncbi:MAG TPA: hypothetical protein VMW77_10070 [Methanoregula sp.]|nr:hypothetical protein [Methanoregula sp.]
MRSHALLGIFTVLVIVLICTAGCTAPQTSPQKTGTGTQAPANAVVTGTSQTLASAQAARTAGIDTTINIHFNDFDCLDVQKELGVDYLYPDQKYIVWATSPGSGSVNVNVLFIDVSDKEKIQTVKPVWDAVAKIWVYEGLVPIVQFNDITTPQEKTITIKKQGKYYLCADDRKESGVNDAILQVPVKLTRL